MMVCIGFQRVVHVIGLRKPYLWFMAVEYFGYEIYEYISDFLHSIAP